MDSHHAEIYLTETKTMASFYRREVLQQAWAIIWRKKFLWFIGFFAGLASYGGEVNVLYHKFNAVDTFQTYLIKIREVFVDGTAHPYIEKFQFIFHQAPGAVMGYIGIVLAILVIGFWLLFISQVAIIRIVGRSQEKKSTGFLDGVSVATEKFWRVVQMYIIGVLLGWGAWILIAGLPAVIFFASGHVAWAYVAKYGTIFSTVISAVVTLVVQYSTAGIVLRDLQPVAALVDSWKLFKKNILVSIEMAAIIFVINFGVVLVTFGIYDVLGLLYSVAGFIILLLLVAVEFSILSAFSYASWTILYQKLVSGSAKSKIGEWTTQLASFTNNKREAA